MQGWRITSRRRQTTRIETRRQKPPLQSLFFFFRSQQKIGFLCAKMKAGTVVLFTLFFPVLAGPPVEAVEYSAGFPSLSKFLATQPHDTERGYEQYLQYLRENKFPGVPYRRIRSWVQYDRHEHYVVQFPYDTYGRRIWHSLYDWYEAQAHAQAHFYSRIYRHSGSLQDFLLQMNKDRMKNFEATYEIKLEDLLKLGELKEEHDHLKTEKFKDFISNFKEFKDFISNFIDNEFEDFLKQYTREAKATVKVMKAMKEKTLNNLDTLDTLALDSSMDSLDSLDSSDSSDSSTDSSMDSLDSPMAPMASMDCAATSMDCAATSMDCAATSMDCAATSMDCAATSMDSLPPGRRIWCRLYDWYDLNHEGEYDIHDVIHEAAAIDSPDSPAHPLAPKSRRFDILLNKREMETFEGTYKIKLEDLLELGELKQLYHHLRAEEFKDFINTHFEKFKDFINNFEGDDFETFLKNYKQGAKATVKVMKAMKEKTLNCVAEALDSLAQTHSHSPNRALALDCLAGVAYHNAYRDPHCYSDSRSLAHALARAVDSMDLALGYSPNSPTHSLAVESTKRQRSITFGLTTLTIFSGLALLLFWILEEQKKKSRTNIKA